MSKIAWLVPDIIEGSGGHRTIFQNVQALIDAGHSCDIYMDGNYNSGKHIKEKVIQFFGETHANFHLGWQLKFEYDLAFATIMYSAKVLHDQDVKAKKAYFVQDYEAFFNPMGDNYLIGENSYRLNLIPITIGNWLSKTLREVYNAPSTHFNFCADLNIYHPTPKVKKEKAVCMIYQPEKPRRGAYMGIEALGILKHWMPEVKIYLYGSRAKGNVWFDHENLELIEIEECNELYNKCEVGLCISSSNPSRIPFEMMAAGLPVVDIYRDNNLYDTPDEGILLADQTPEALAAAMAYLLDNKSIRKDMSQYAVNFMKKNSLEDGFSQFVSNVENILSGKIDTSETIERSYNKPPFTVPCYNNYFLTQQDPKKNVLNENSLTSKLPIKSLGTSVDIWDTIIRRTCHPDEAKINTARHLFLKYNANLNPWFRNPHGLFKERVNCELEIGQNLQSHGFDDEYYIGDVINLWIRKSLLKFTEQDVVNIADELLKVEIRFEKSVTYKDNQILEFLDKNDLNIDEITLFSDFYMSSSQLEEVVDSCKIDFKPKEIISSCELLYNKRTGNAFKHLNENNLIDNKAYCHLGDNKESDYNKPKSLGFRSLHYVNKDEELKRKKLNQLFEKRAWSLEDYIPEIEKELATITTPDSVPNDKKSIFELGVKYSSLFYTFILFVIEECVKEGIETTFYFTREGIFFKKIHDLIAKNNPLSVNVPGTELLEVSRTATFLPSLREFSTNEMMRIWNMYSSQSMGAMIKTFGLNLNNFLEIFEKHDIDPDLPIQYPWKDSKIVNLFEDKNFTGLLEKKCAEKRDLLFEYLSNKGFADSGEKIGIVDIGWRGTIQDNLAHIFKENEIFGYYFGQQQHLNDQPLNVIKKSFGPDARIDPEHVMNILRHVAPIEMISNAPDGSSTGYKRNERGTIETHKKIDSNEDAIFKSFTYYFQEGVLHSIPVISSFIRNHAISAKELQPYCTELLTEIIYNPPKEMAEAYFNLNHNEEFGTGSFSDKNFSVPKILKKKSINSNDWNKIKEFLDETGWPGGFLVKHDNNYLLDRYRSEFINSSSTQRNSKYYTKFRPEKLRNYKFRLIRAYRELGLKETIKKILIKISDKL